MPARDATKRIAALEAQVAALKADLAEARAAAAADTDGPEEAETTAAVPARDADTDALADAANLIPEIDESDNRAHLRVLGPDLEVAETWADPDALGRTFVAAAVRNQGTTTTLPTTIQFHRDTITGTARQRLTRERTCITPP